MVRERGAPDLMLWGVDGKDLWRGERRSDITISS